MTSFAPQDFKIQIKNCGPKKWLENLRFLCVEGVYKGISKEISSLDVGDEDKIGLFWKKLDFMQPVGGFRMKKINVSYLLLI